MIRRMIGAARLRSETYEEVEADRSATRQALLVVVIVALAAGIGNLGSGSIIGLVVGIVAAIAGWAFWAWITYFVGTTIFKTPETQADWGQLARTLGFAQSPGVLKVFGVIPAIGPVVFAVVSIWQLVAMVIAIRQALDYTSTLRAIGVAVVGFIAYAVLTSIVFALLRQLIFFRNTPRPYPSAIVVASSPERPLGSSKTLITEPNAEHPMDGEFIPRRPPL